jgi:hypothetical protein
MTISHTGPKNDFRRQIAHANFLATRSVFYTRRQKITLILKAYPRETMSDTRIEITDLSTGQYHDLSFSLGKKAYPRETTLAIECQTLVQK